MPFHHIQQLLLVLFCCRHIYVRYMYKRTCLWKYVLSHLSSCISRCYLHESFRRSSFNSCNAPFLRPFSLHLDAFFAHKCCCRNTSSVHGQYLCLIFSFIAFCSYIYRQSQNCTNFREDRSLFVVDRTSH